MDARIAIPYEDGNVFPHFGKSAAFKIYVVTDGKVASSEVVPADGAGHEALGLWLVMRGVNAVVCGGIGPGAQGALRAAGIWAFPGVEGSADAAIEKFLSGELVAQAAATCDRHVHAGGCGSHGCGGCHGCRGRAPEPAITEATPARPSA